MGSGALYAATHVTNTTGDPNRAVAWLYNIVQRASSGINSDLRWGLFVAARLSSPKSLAIRPNGQEAFVNNVVEDLLTWEEESDALLPNGMTPEEIALIEAQGYVVNLETGEIIPLEEANDYGVPAL